MIKKFIGTPGVGKTAQLLLWSVENGIKYVFCEDPVKMIIRARNLGVNGLTFLSYDKYDEYKIMFKEDSITCVIDDIDKFIESCYNIVAYSESI